MNLTLSPEQSFFQETTRRFLEGQAPLTKVRELADGAAGFDRGWWRRGAELGWTAFLVPEDHGGGTLSGGGVADLAIVAEEFGRLVSPGPLHPTNIVAAALAASGTPQQQAEVLPGIVSGDVVATWCFHEPGRGWRPSDIELVARPSGDGFVLAGTKAMVEAAGEADWLLVTARADGDGDGVAQFLVKADAPGVTITPLNGLDLVRRFGRVAFDDVAVAGAARVGRGDATDDVERQLQIGATLECAQMAGAADRVLEFTVQYAFDRYSFGRQLASYQALKHRFADMKLVVEATHAAVDGAAQALDGGAGAANGSSGPSAARLVSAAKVYAGDRVPELVQDCVQMHGGIGVTWEHDIHLYLRRVTLARALYGTPNDHRERLAAAAGL
ncbi:MAG TPA: acyl-CoA dehydrogenase family protein [Acidimicrobiales bacterium]|nr:acyl-CoA dehydrogenase family protein [Acidimicrobiales bacterium]